MAQNLQTMSGTYFYVSEMYCFCGTLMTVIVTIQICHYTLRYQE